ncbi:hypothetical protein [Hydrogenophaga luteola]|uniref:Uncharacterized protein n=1 Tax=Hydrogenophaga luteola TaxID=1591122 RepID=A0ABV7VXX7_9BURK
MPALVTQRKATDEELECLANMLRDAPTSYQRFKQGVENAVVLWAVTSLCFVVIWSVIAWVAGKVADVHWGLSSPVGVWAVIVVIPLCGIYAAIYSVRWVRAWKDYRPLIQADLSAGTVLEERYAFTAAKRFQEPEHGGLIYFLNTVQGKVFTMFDAESQDLGIYEQDPLTSSFRPMSELVLVRSPHTGFVISKTFSGAPLELDPALELEADPKDWPEFEAYCHIAWADLESRLGSRGTTPFGGAAPS